jgi:hypothetical protein
MAKSSTSTSGSPIVSLAFWLDLRGYGGMLNGAGFDPTCTEAKPALLRLRRFQEIVADHSLTTFPTLAINDGAVAYRDIGLTRRDRAWLFIQRSWDLFQAATKADRELGGIGLRGVLAAGLRSRGSNRGILAQNATMAKTIEDLAGGRISKDEALKACWRVRRVHDVVPQLQANFAFTRAYTAEQGASVGKLKGSLFYLETRIFKDGIPHWMTADKPINWEPTAKWLSSLATSFVEIQAINQSAPDCDKAIRTGREILATLRSS